MTDGATTGRAHLRWGWWGLFTFSALGVVLESMHGFKIGWYLDTTNETRRLMWTLTHVHGALLSVVHIVFALALPRLQPWEGAGRTAASRCLFAALLLLPGGFFLGGFFAHGGDPGLGILLVPAGAVLLLLALFLTARAAGRTDT